MANGDGRNTKDDLEQALTGGLPYPTLTIPISVDDGGVAGDDRATNAGLGREVTSAIRAVLGWEPNKDDPNGFTGALNQSFKLSMEEGHVVSEWKQRTFAAVTDLQGGVSGAQASVYVRFKQAVEAAQPLFDGLYTLSADSDREETEAIKALIKQHLNDVVSELGREGGPRVSRVDHIFDLLLGRDETLVAAQAVSTDGNANVVSDLRVSAPSADEVAGEVGRLREELGLRVDEGRAIDMKEEENQTNYRIAADYVTGMRTTYQANRKFFSRAVIGGQQFFGTQMVHLTRLLSVIAEQVKEVRFVFASLFIRAREQQTLEIVPQTAVPASIHDVTDFQVGRIFIKAPTPIELKQVLLGTKAGWIAQEAEPIYLDEALSWVDTFAREEGPALIRAAGKLGVAHAFVPTAKRLKDVVAGLRAPKNVERLPAAFKTLRVEHVLFELETQFDALLSAAGATVYETETGYDGKGPPPPGPAV